MTLAELNSLRPGDRIVYTVRDTQTRGRIISIWRDDTLVVEWSEGIKDTIPITEHESQYLHRAQQGQG